jgi:pimeloyl-ACP methyl ester carboxylesterase
MKGQWDRIADVISFPEQPGLREVYGFAGAQASVLLEGQRLIPRGKPSKTLFVFMHPSSTLQLLPMPIALAESGAHVLCAATRYAKNDTALIMEKCLIDLGAWIRTARQDWGYERVMLVGWSGGGSLSLFYQAEAEMPSIVATPAGDPVDLKGAKLPKADGIIFIAAHLSRAETLTGWIDPSVEDERNPDKRNLYFDIYAENCPNKPPFTPQFVAEFRAAQIARNRRITNTVQEQLERLKALRGPEQERGFVTHRTMCDVRWIDTNIEPNERRANWCYLGDPRTANVGLGLARFSMLRSWLSQWSYDLSNAKGSANAARIKSTPVLQIENMADDAVPASHNAIINAALATPRKQWERIEGATHYYAGQPEKLSECLDTIYGWVERSGFNV